MKIYFEDGELVSPSQLPFGPHYRVDATKGVSKNIEELEYFNYFCPNVIIYTNSILAFSNEYAWNEELKAPEIYIRAGEHMVFVRIDALTTRELRQGHNLAHMYVAGEFEKGMEEYK